MRGKSDAAVLLERDRRAGEAIGGDRAVGIGEVDRHVPMPHPRSAFPAEEGSIRSHGLSLGRGDTGMGQPDWLNPSSGTSSQRRSFQLCRPSIASCTPLAPASRP